MIRNYFITTLRTLLRNRFFSVVNIFGLSVGIASCLLIILYAKDEMSYDHFHSKADRIYRITADITNEQGKINKTGTSGIMHGPRFKAGIPEIEEQVRLVSDVSYIKTSTDIVEQEAFWADEHFFDVFTFKAIHGSLDNALTDPGSIVISKATAKKFFGQTDVIGRTLMIKIQNAFEPFLVSAVIENSPENSSIDPQLLLSMNRYVQFNRDNYWMNFFLNTFILLKENTSPADLPAKFQKVFETEAAEQLKQMKKELGFTEEIAFGLQPLKEVHLSTDYPATNGLRNASNPVYSYILCGIALFILVIACINFINLTIARSLKRKKEIGVRKVVGGRRRQLIWQFLGETFLLCAFSLLTAIVMAILAIPFFNHLSGKALSFSYLLDTKLALAFSAFFIFTVVLSGSYPALVLSSFSPVETLYNRFRFHGKNYLSKSLIVLQFALATFLVIATITVHSQFTYMTDYDIGYDKSNVLIVSTGSMNRHKLETLKQQLLSDPSVKIVTGQRAGFTTNAYVNGNVTQSFGFSRIDEDRFALFGIPITMGRNFSKEYPSDSTSSVIVNESFVKAAQWKNPIGEIVDFYWRNQTCRVVGVVKDFHTAALTEKITPQVFSLNPEISYSTVFLKIDPKSKGNAMRHTEKTIRSMFPSIPYQYSFLEEDLERQYVLEERWRKIVFAAAILAIFISCTGLFGMTLLSMEKRAKEISIRKVLGASAGLIAASLSSNYLRLIGLSLCFALPAAWWSMQKWLDNYPYRIHLGLEEFIPAILCVLLLGLLTVSYHSLSAARSNPVKNLRSE